MPAPPNAGNDFTEELVGLSALTQGVFDQLAEVLDEELTEIVAAQVADSQ